MIQINQGSSLPISRQIVDDVRMKIVTGDLPAGAQLPSVRVLAGELGINPNTVAKAYAELTITGWLIARRGVGLFATRPEPVSDFEKSRRFESAVQCFVREIVALGISGDEAVSRVESSLRDLGDRS